MISSPDVPASPRGLRRAVVAGGLVLADPARPPERADILVEGEQITALVPPGSATGGDRAVIDAAGCAVIPGLVNAHTHGHGGLAKGSGDRWTLELLLNASPWLGGARSDEDRYLATQLAAVEMLLKGCTSCFDLSLAAPFPTHAGLHAAAQAYQDTGMRAVVAPMVADIAFYRAVPGLLDAAPDSLRGDMDAIGAPEGGALLAAIAAIARDWPFASDRVRFALAPTIPLHSSDAFLTGCHRIAREHGLRLQTHLAESRPQAVAARARYGRSLTAHLDGLGILDDAFSGAHGVWLDADDRARLADRGAAIAHNPGSNLRLGSGVADLGALLDAGVSVGIGTDGGASSDHQNMFEALRLACVLSRVRGRPSAAWVSAPQALALATTGGARLLGFEGVLGRIAPGHKADLVLLDLGHVNYVPLTDLATQIVHVEDATAVAKVLVGGQIVMEGGRVTTVDVAALARKAQAAAERLAGANAEARARAERLAPFVDCFCHGLARRPWTDRPESGRFLAEPA